MGVDLIFPRPYIYALHENPWLQLATLDKVLCNVASALFTDRSIRTETHPRNVERPGNAAGRSIVHGSPSSLSSKDRERPPFGGRTQNGRERSNRHSDSLDTRSTSSGKTDELIQMVARLCLRQEDQMNALNLDRSFLLFVQCGRGNLMPLMIETSIQ